MAKRSQKQKIVEVVEPKFYAHYDGMTRNIFSVNNHKIEGWPHFVEISFPEYERLVTGKDEFTDFHIGTVIAVDGTASLGLVSKKVIQEHNFKNRLLYWIERETENADMEIHYDAYNSQWVFLVSDEFRQRYYSNQLPISSISFFITLGKDPNFLLRVIDIDLKSIVSDKILINFDSKWESNIDLIAITSSLSTITYSLKIWKIYEQDQSN
jgi:hypothetical protein